MKKNESSNSRFAFVLTGWALMSLCILGFIIIVVSRMSFAFFEANGMLKDAFMREALYQQLQLVLMQDPYFIFILPAGLAGLFAISFLFARSQCAYVRRFAETLQSFSEQGTVPLLSGLGPLEEPATDFFEVTQCDMARDTSERRKNAMNRALQNWPKSPKISLLDMSQHMAVSAILAAFFAAFCQVLFLRISERIVSLGVGIVHFTTANGPQFLHEQFDMVGLLIYTIVGVTGVAFLAAGYRLGYRMAECNYAILRDLKRFMMGDYTQRLFLRSQDPVSEYIPSLNQSLAKLEIKLQGSAEKPRLVPAEG